MCKKIQLKAAFLGLLFGLGGLISVSAAPCPDSATDSGSGQSIGTTAKGSGINVQSGNLPDGVAPCQVIVVNSTVKYAGITTYAWSGTTAEIKAYPGLVVAGTAELTQNVAPANYTTVVLSEPADPVCPGILSETLVSFEYTPSAADVAAGGVTFRLEYFGTAQSGANDQVSGTATITVKVQSCDDGDPCTDDSCVPNLQGLAACVNTPTTVCTQDEDLCTVEACDPATGNCVSGPSRVCTPDADLCTVESCNPATGNCVSGPSRVCNDNDPCTDDRCDAATGECVYTDNGTCVVGKGCTPGFYKNCTAQWCSAHKTSDLVSSVFIVPACIGNPNLGTKTLLQALSLQGGSTLNGGAQILLRAGVAAVLNACKGFGYPLTEVQIIDQVNAALDSCTRSTMIDLATVLDGYNNLGCTDASGNSLPCKPKP